MRVVRKARRTVPFGSLKIGDQFERGDDVYMKISEKEMLNAVLLSGCGEGRVGTFESNNYVIPVVVELHVFDKE